MNVFCTLIADRSPVEMGGKVWVNPSIVLGHVGEMNYKGALVEIMLQVPPTSA